MSNCFSVDSDDDEVIVETIAEYLEVEDECGSDCLTVDVETETVLESPAQQGPPGPQGLPGQAGVAYLTYVADGALGGHRVVVPTTAGKVGYADNTNVAHANTVLGLTLGAAVDGDDVNVQTSGEVTEPSWNWTMGLPVFLATNGLLTQSYPTAAFVIILGVAVAPTKLVVDVKIPFVLEI